MANYCQLWLTCKDTVEADTILKFLLEKKLVTCVKQFPVESNFRWHGKLGHDNETLLIMDSREDLFDTIEDEIRRLHSYETFVLQAIPLVKVSKEAKEWLKMELHDG